MMKAVKTVLVVFLAVMIMAGCAPTVQNVELSQEIKDKMKNTKKVCILPAQVTISKAKITSGEELFLLEGEIGEVLVEAVSRVAQEAKLTVVPNRLSKQEMEADPDLKYELADLQQKFDTVVSGEMKGNMGHKVLNENHKLGPEVIPFAQAAGSDSLIFIRSQGEVQSKGKEAVFLLGGYVIFSPLVVLVSVVDGNDGTIIYGLYMQILLDNYVDFPSGKNDKPEIHLIEKRREKLKDELVKILKKSFDEHFNTAPAATDQKAPATDKKGTS